MAKKQGAATIDGLEAARYAVAAMTRATKVLEGQHKGESLRLAPGTHTVDMTIRVAGDLTQGEDSTAESKPSPLFSERELLAAILLPMPDAERRKAIRLAVNRIGKALSAEGKTGGADEALNHRLKTVKDELREFAEKAGLVADAGSTVRAGKLEGKPGVQIHGRCGERDVEVVIDREGAA